ncbi:MULTISPECIES: MBL fold metallo-hydrolase [Parachlamydia]|jgi:L-ascorbate metabolism protein UlaG (beta-lactamase superfamily)|uniref:N-acyl-phosphatidylethanolamine-hydrolyzing phospholipase D n=2 Tax=Parachlamydia acanthamoebae TaxID=83552 RepID=F8KXU1_PARAV|nr:MBL fold metallo-hydrolase [Parachlamydia acanthamoebae]CCB85671.1 N-acyl-phosphatidylethanolamine-hydrolyzing phospholipase D [Parachlamydia acanthamoebae UV-7]
MLFIFCSLCILAIFCFYFKRSYYQGPKSDHFTGKIFYNPWQVRPNSFFSFLKWKWDSRPKEWPAYVHVSSFETPRVQVTTADVFITFIGHSTVLIQTEGMNILTDPVWSEKIGPYEWLGIKRVCDPGIPFASLPKIDLVLVSHNHYDHLDLKTLKKLWDRDCPMILTPLGNDAVIHQKHPEIQVKTLDWGECRSFNDQISLYLEPVQHWSARGIFDRDKALWGAFVIQTPNGNIYFPGDSGYCKEIFRKTKEKFGPFRLAFLPIGAYEPRWFMCYGHMDPEESVQAFKDLGEPLTIGIHYGTFQLSDEGYLDPVAALQHAKEKFHVPETQFRLLAMGEISKVC